MFLVVLNGGETMYVFERIIGVSIYVLCLIAICFFITKVKGLSIHLNIYNMLLSLMGFFYVPLNGSDLVRIQQTMHIYARMSWTELFDTMITHSSPITVLYYYFVGNLGDDRFLPFISSIITYTFCFALLKKCIKKFNLNKKEISLILLFFMSRGLHMMIIANIRTAMSLAIIAFSIYQILIEEKSFIKYFILMMVGALIHNVGIFAIILFFIFIIFEGAKKGKRFIAFLKILGVSLIGYFYGQSYIQSAISKGFDYLSYSMEKTGYFYFWELLLSVVVLLITIIYICIYCKAKKNFFKYNEKKAKTYYTYLKFQFFLALVSFCLLFIEFNSGLRLSWLVTIQNIPMLAMLFDSDYISLKTKKQLKLFIFISCFILLFIACTRGDLCSLKFI